jgi:hypothetical protein
MNTKKIIITAVIIMWAISSAFAPDVRKQDEKTLQDVFVEQARKMLKYEREKKQFNRFLDALAQRESSGRADVINSYGAMGKYQFTKSTLKSLGYDVSVRKFANNPGEFSLKMQEEAVRKLIKSNSKVLEDVINKYSGRVYKGILISKSGIIAAAHLAGAFNVKKFFKYGYDPHDAYGTNLTDYLKRFSGYDLTYDLYDITGKDTPYQTVKG